MLSAEWGGNLLPRVIRVVREDLRLGDASAGIDADTAIFTGGLGLDSIDIVELITLVEQEFDIELQYEDLDPVHFRTMGTLVAVIARRVSERA